MESFRERISRLSPQRLTLLAMELHDRVTALEGAAREPIAVVAMACRFPGDARTPAAFWQNLQQGRDCVSAISDKRWRLAGSESAQVLETSAKWGALLDSIEMFDPGFFHISPSEAMAMDPQQRILLEVCWEAIENAGIPADSLTSSETGVFIGMSSTDYALLANSLSGDGLNKYVVTGVANSIAVGRVSYLLGLQGPNMAIDTSCSSSATSIHLAVQSLRRGECSLALAGGVHLALIPQTNATLSRFNLLAADGRCKTFSNSADGIGRGEGCGILVLKRLRDAERDEDNILGVIRGTACNQDGRTSGLTAPNGLAQEKVLRAALKDAALTAADIDFVETHGTGTALGDPIEVAALGRVFAGRKEDESKVTIGSVKSNLGHLEAAAGVAGVIKVILALQREEIPASLHCATLNRRLPWNDLPLLVAQKSTGWKRGKKSRAAGISSFGYSGTNVHIVIEEAPLRAASVAVEAPLQVMTASAKSVNALRQLCGAYSRHLKENPDISIADFAHSVNAGRSHFKHRFARVVSSVEEASDAYAEFAYEEAFEAEKGTASSRNRAATLSADASSLRVLNDTLDQYLSGVDVVWKTTAGHHPRPKLVLPNYPFERQRYWLNLPEKNSAQPQPLSNDRTHIEITETPDSWLYEIAWEPVESALTPETSLSPQVPLGPVDRIMASIGPALEDASASIDCSFLPQFKKNADELSVGFILQALEQNRLVLEPGKRVDVDVCGLLGISRRYERLLGRMFGILEEDGIVLKVGTDWVVQRLPDRFDTGIAIQRLRTAYPLAKAHLAIFERASLLGQVLQGRMTGLEILFPSGSTLLAEQLYQQTIHARVMNPLIGRLAQHVIEALPVDRKLRILELGAGTGSTTAFVVPLLPSERIEYFFTDVSKHFLAGAIKKFAQYPFMHYALHDIEDSAVLDGEEARSFDLVIAANVLHATKSLRSTLANVRSLLAPRGFLLLLEASHTERLADITLGTIEGWWRFEDSDLRQHSALIAPALWQTLLSEFGFESALLPAAAKLFGVTEDEPAILARLTATTDAVPPRSVDSLDTKSRKIMLVSARDGHAETMAKELLHLGAAVVHASPGDQLGRLSGQEILLPVNEKEKWSRLFAEPFSEGIETFDVVYLASSSSASDTQAEESQRLATETVSLLQEFLSRRSLGGSLWFVTSGMQPIRSSDAQLAASVVAGFIRVVAAEYPNLSCHSIDADNQAQDGSLALIARAIMAKDPIVEPELAIRDGRLLVPRLHPVAAVVRSTVADVAKDRMTGAWLITGGFGALGLHVASWLATNWGGDLVLFGRNSPSADAVEAIEQIRRLGVRVTIKVGNVSDEDDVRHLFEQIAREERPLRGIIHAAAVLADASAAQLSRESLRQVLEPKVMGSWLLHKYSREMNLDHFVLFSSAAAVLGTPGQLNYAMANAFMDSLAHYRQAQGFPGLSINWGPWTSSGADVRRDFLTDWRAVGGESMTPSQALDRLGWIMRSGKAQVAVLPIDWNSFSARWNRAVPAMLKCLATPVAAYASSAPAETSSLTDQLEQSTPAQRIDVLAAHLELRLKQLLGFDRDESLPQDTPFINLGLDSLMSLELKNEIQSALGIELPSSLFFDHRSLRELREYFDVFFKVEGSKEANELEKEGYLEFRI